jgi:hypothetical protein
MEHYVLCKKGNFVPLAITCSCTKEVTIVLDPDQEARAGCAVSWDRGFWSRSGVHGELPCIGIQAWLGWVLTRGSKKKNG